MFALKPSFKVVGEYTRATEFKFLYHTSLSILYICPESIDYSIFLHNKDVTIQKETLTFDCSTSTGISMPVNLQMKVTKISVFSLSHCKCLHRYFLLEPITQKYLTLCFHICYVEIYGKGHETSFLVTLTFNFKVNCRI